MTTPFPEEADLTAALADAVDDSPTWDQWAAAEPQIAPLIAALRAGHATAGPSDDVLRAGIDPAWDVAALLSHVTHRTAHIYGEMAGRRADAHDLPALLDAFFGADRARMRVAKWALTTPALPEALPPLLRVVEEFDAEAGPRFHRNRIADVRPILAATPETLPIARAWLRAAGWARPSVALSILEVQAQQADVLPLRALLAASLDRELQDPWAPYTVEGCLAALAPFAAEVPYAELARVFESTRALWPRCGAAELMAEGHPATFSGAYAIECLWDCEEELVRIGCASADLALPMVRERLHLLAHSPYEDEAVRQAARQRLGSSPPQD